MSITFPSQNLTSHQTEARLRTPSDVQSKKVFSFCLIFIVCVSIYDTYLVAAYRDTILLNERNPICLFLIQQDFGQLTWFLGGKLVGNLVVVGTLLGLLFSGFRQTLTVAKGVAGFQFLLLIYLHFSDPMSGVLDFDGITSPYAYEFREALLSVTAHVGVLALALTGGVLIKRKWDQRRLRSVG